MSGRPPALQPPVQDKLLKAIRAGAPIAVACQYAGVSRASYYAWRDRGQQARDRRAAGKAVPKREQRYLAFVDILDTAQAEAEVNLLALLRSHAADRWQAAAWVLERRWPERYSRTERTELSGPAGGPVQLDQQVASVEVKVDLATDTDRARGVLAALADTGLLAAAAPHQPVEDAG